MSRPKGVVVDGALISAERERRGISAADLADQTREIARAEQSARGHAPTDPGLTARTVINAESGKPASKRTARLIAQALQLPYLFVVRHDLDEINEHLAREALNPEPPPLEWAGRQQQSDDIAHNLLNGEQRACIAGASGSGKTALAQDVVQRDDVRAHYSHGVVWIGHSPALAEKRYGVVMAQIARALDFFHHLPSPTDHSLETIGKRFQYCLAKGAVLLVFDDLQDDTPLSWFVPPNSPVGVLITTRRQTLARSFKGAYHQLGDLTLDEATQLLRSSVSDASRVSTKAVASLIAQTSGMPNAIRLAAIALRNDDSLNLSRYVQNYADDLATLRNRRSSRIGNTPPPYDERTERQLASLESHGRYVDGELFGLLRTLTVFDTAPFSKHWVTALMTAEAQRLSERLEELMGLVQGAAGAQGESRLKVEDVVHIFGKHHWSAAEGQHDPLVLARAGLIEAERLLKLPPLDRWRAFDAFRPLWSRCFAQLADTIMAADGDTALSEQALRLRASPAAPAQGGPPIIIELALALRGLLTQGTLPEARVWLYAAYATARHEGDQLAEGQLAEMIGLHCYPDYPTAFDWFTAAARALEDCGDRLHLASVMTELGKMHHGMTRWEAGLQALREAYQLSVAAAAPAALIAVRANNLALGHLVLPNAGLAAIEASTPMLRDAMQRTRHAAGLLRILNQVARLNLLIAHRRAEVPPPDDIDTTLDAFAAAVGHDSLYLTYPILSAEWLGLPITYPSAGAARSAISYCRTIWSKAIYGDRGAVDPLLRHVSCVVANLRRLIRLKHDEPGTISPRGSWAIIDATSSNPALFELTGSIAQLYIVEPFQELFNLSLLHQVLDVIERGYGPQHHAFFNCAALYREQLYGEPLDPSAEAQLARQIAACEDNATDRVVVVTAAA